LRFAPTASMMSGGKMLCASCAIAMTSAPPEPAFALPFSAPLQAAIVRHSAAGTRNCRMGEGGGGTTASVGWRGEGKGAKESSAPPGPTFVKIASAQVVCVSGERRIHPHGSRGRVLQRADRAEQRFSHLGDSRVAAHHVVEGRRSRKGRHR